MAASSFLAHIANTSGPARGYENLRGFFEVNNEHLWAAVPASGTTAAVEGPYRVALTDLHTIRNIRQTRRAGVPVDVAAILHPGPRAVGTILDIHAVWVPSNIGTVTAATDVTNFFPVHVFTMGSTVEAPPQGYRVPLPDSMDLPAWSAQNAAHPVLYLVVRHHAVTSGARTTTGHFLHIEITGRVDTYGGF